MPRLDGREALRRLRQAGNWTPSFSSPRLVNLQSGHGLEEGADDYLNKPFDPLELVAASSVLRRAHLVVPPSPRHNVAEQRPTPGSPGSPAWLNGGTDPDAQGLRLLEYLMMHPMSSSAGTPAGCGLAGLCHRHRTVDTRMPNCAVLGDDPTSQYIETVPGQGYRFVGVVEAGS